MITGFPKRLYGHLRFTLAEYRAQKPKIGRRMAAQYMGMRAISPFGIGKAWQRSHKSNDPRVRELRTTGFCELPPRTDGEVQCLVRFFLRQMEQRADRPFESLDSFFEYGRNVGTERPDGVLTSGDADDAISRLVRNRDLIDLASDYLGLPAARMVANANIDALIRLDRARIETGYDNALRFHRDVDSFRFLKMFVYLTDCRQGDGHHEVYLYSHRHHPVHLGPIARYEPERIERHIPVARLKRVEGPAGYMFAEDTFAFHRGTAPTRNDRLICNLEYMDQTFLPVYGTSFRLV